VNDLREVCEPTCVRVVALEVADSGYDDKTATTDRLTHLCSEPGCCQNCCQGDRRLMAQHKNSYVQNL